MDTNELRVFESLIENDFHFQRKSNSTEFRDSCQTKAGRFFEDYLPLNRGGRFSKKAATPSLKSGDCPDSIWHSASRVS
jgi:hypothetical protein